MMHVEWGGRVPRTETREDSKNKLQKWGERKETMNYRMIIKVQFKKCRSLVCALQFLQMSF